MGEAVFGVEREVVGEPRRRSRCRRRSAGTCRAAPRGTSRTPVPRPRTASTTHPCPTRSRRGSGSEPAVAARTNHRSGWRGGSRARSRPSPSGCRRRAVTGGELLVRLPHEGRVGLGVGGAVRRSRRHRRRGGGGGGFDVVTSSYFAAARRTPVTGRGRFERSLLCPPCGDASATWRWPRSRPPRPRSSRRIVQRCGPATPSRGGSAVP